jgi:hypothetical protein
MSGVGKVRPEGCICEQCSDILCYRPLGANFFHIGVVDYGNK